MISFEICKYFQQVLSTEVILEWFSVVILIFLLMVTKERNLAE